MKKLLLTSIPIVLILLAGMTGCSKSPDERIERMAQQSLDAQARQNDRLVQQNQQVIEASKELVAADAQARTKMTELQHDLQADQREVGRQRDGLEQERRQIAAERYREQLVSSAITTIGILIVAGLPLLLGIYMLRAVQYAEASDPVLTEVLIDEMLADRPRLLARTSMTPLDGPPIIDDSEENWNHKNVFKPCNNPGDIL
jgi:TolA-binding protein